MNNKTTFFMDSPERARITGPLVLDTVAAVFSEARKAQENGKGFSEVDLKEVSRVDSSGLALLLEWQATARSRDNSIIIRNAPADLLTLARLCETDDLLTIESRQAA